MKKLTYLLMLVFTACSTHSNDEATSLRDGDVISYAPATDEMRQQALFLSEYVAELSDISLEVRAEGGGAISLMASDTVAERLGDEGFRLLVDAQGIRIEARTATGTFYGMQELRQLLPIDTLSRCIALPAMCLEKSPRFPYRGMHLDVSRHYFPIDFVKRYIDLLALHQMNRLHWHLTDNQSWRFEVKRYPELTEMGGRHEHLLDGERVPVAFPERGDTLPASDEPRYYTQEECREIVRYAAERHITVIPEIDMPGHMRAACAIMPQLACGGMEGMPKARWNDNPDVLCVGREQTVTWAKEILDELMEVFPSEYIHVGGDECPKGQWARCATCQEQARRLGLKRTQEWTVEEQLQSHFIGELEEHLNAHGRKLIGWDETLEGGPAPHATIMTWRSVEEGIKAVKLGHDVVMAPGSHCYFDGYQSKDLQHEPLAIGGYLPLERVYDFNPIPDTLSAEEARHIIGVQANLWTEYIAHGAHAEYMVLPRMAALREVQWRQSDGDKDWPAFAQSVPHLLHLYQRLGYHYAPHILDVALSAKADSTPGRTIISLSAIEGAQICYTTNGTEPTLSHGEEYLTPIAIDSSCTLRARAFYQGQEGRTLEQSIDVNLATGKPVTLLIEPHRRYTFQGASTLVDGISVGNTGYGSGGWLGWGGRDMVAVIDLCGLSVVSEMELNAIVLPNSWIFAPERVWVETSTDGIRYKKMAATSCNVADHLSANSVERVKLSFSPTEARYVKVTAACLKRMPRWHNGAGTPAFVFIDEIKLR